MPEAKPAFAAHSTAAPSEPAAPVALAPLDAFDETAPRVVAPIERQDGTTLARLVGVMRRLLAPGGCPWDREQTFETLRKYVLEEACEVIDAIDSSDRGALREELGDLLLQVVFQAELGRREGSFAIDDVSRGSSTSWCTGTLTSSVALTPVRRRVRDGGGRRRGAPQLGEAQGAARRAAAACSPGCRGACRRSRAPSGSARRWRASASTGRARRGRAPR